jgi:NADH-quinone oxidoreductase subunit A
MLLDYIPIFLVLGFAIVFAVSTVAASSIFGPKKPTSEKLSTYESGMKPFGTTNERVSIKYYLVAMLFIIFDLEVVFVYPWAVRFKQLTNEFGIFPFVTMLIFLVIFELGYLYVWKKGGFNWD